MQKPELKTIEKEPTVKEFNYYQKAILFGLQKKLVFVRPDDEGFLNKVAKRRAKNKRAKQNRKANRG